MSKTFCVNDVEVENKEVFTLESETEGYDTYWTLEWSGCSFREALENRNDLLDNYCVYDKTRITMWINGVRKQVFYYNGRVEVVGNDR